MSNTQNVQDRMTNHAIEEIEDLKIESDRVWLETLDIFLAGMIRWEKPVDTLDYRTF